MNPPERSIISSIREVSDGVERLFDTKTVVLHEMPAFLLFSEQAAMTNRDHVSLVVKLMSIITEEAKK